MMSEPVSEMVERVARAMCTAAMIDPDWCDEPLSAQGGNPQWHYKAALARVAIEAMREPTPTMLDAAEARAFVGYTGTPCLTPDAAWGAMIEAALARP